MDPSNLKEILCEYDNVMPTLHVLRSDKKKQIRDIRVSGKVAFCRLFYFCGNLFLPSTD